MVSEKMYGVFEHRKKEYPFVLEGQILTIPQVPFQYKRYMKQKRENLYSVFVGYMEFRKELTWRKPMLRSVTKQHMGKFKDQETLKLQRIRYFGVLSM